MIPPQHSIQEQYSQTKDQLNQKLTRNELMRKQLTQTNNQMLAQLDFDLSHLYSY